MDIIERLQDDELYIDAIDDAVKEIEDLRNRNERHKTAIGFYIFFLDYVAELLKIKIQNNKISQSSEIFDALSKRNHY